MTKLRDPFPTISLIQIFWNFSTFSVVFSKRGKRNHDAVTRSLCVTSVGPVSISGVPTTSGLELQLRSTSNVYGEQIKVLFAGQQSMTKLKFPAFWWPKRSQVLSGGLWSLEPSAESPSQSSSRKTDYAMSWMTLQILPKENLPYLILHYSTGRAGVLPMHFYRPVAELRQAVTRRAIQSKAALPQTHQKDISYLNVWMGNRPWYIYIYIEMPSWLSWSRHHGVLLPFGSRTTAKASLWIFALVSLFWSGLVLIVKTGLGILQLRWRNKKAWSRIIQGLDVRHTGIHWLAIDIPPSTPFVCSLRRWGSDW